MSSSARFEIAGAGDNRKGHLYNETTDTFEVTALTENISSAPYVFENPVGSYGKSFYHGKFWDNTSTDLGRFVWEAWGAYLGTDGGSGHYWISDGYGGAHSILCGLVNGNLWNGSGGVSFTADYFAQQGEWMHSMCSWDGSFLRIYINGIICGEFSFTGNRVSGSGFGELYIGGSDHANFHGRISQVRGWESANKATHVQNPYFPDGGFVYPITPQRTFSPFKIQRFGANSGEFPSQFCADYAIPGQTVIDQSPGFGGRLHHGVMLGTDLTETRPGGLWVQDPTCPQRLDTDILPIRSLPIPPATPSGAKVFDSFSRAPSLLAFTTTPTLGSTESGSLGPKVWQYGPSNVFGIFDGRAVLQMTGYAYAYILNNSADMDVRVDRRNVSYGLHQTGLLLRWLSDNEYLFVITDGPEASATILLVEKNGATIGNWAAPASWNTLRAVANGTNVSVYCDATLVGSASVTYTTGTGAGIYSHWPPTTARRWDNFTVL